MFGLRGQNGLRQEFKLLLVKKTTGCCFGTIMWGTMPLKPSINN
jgi:hypothetical protein